MFTTHLILEAGPEPDFWTLRAPLVWAGSPTLPDLTVPVGFKTDLASIPRTLRNLPAFDPNGLSRRAAVAHDWLYWWQGWGKDKADDFLREAMVIDGCSRVDADAFYDAVRWFGHSSWEDGAARGLASHFEAPTAYAAWLASVSSI